MTKYKYNEIELETVLCCIANFIQNNQKAKLLFKEEYESYVGAFKNSDYSDMEIAEVLAEDFLGDFLNVFQKIGQGEVANITLICDILDYFSLNRSAIFKCYCTKYEIGVIILQSILRGI